MIRIIIEADDAGREEAEHFCLCLGHQDQLVESFLTLLMQVANGANVAAVNTALGEDEQKLPPLVPGQCRTCHVPMPMPGNLGMCKDCIDGIINDQAEAMRIGTFRAPPPGVSDPSLGGMFDPPNVGQCLNCGGPIGTGFMFCPECTQGARHVSAG